MSFLDITILGITREIDRVCRDIDFFVISGHDAESITRIQAA